MSKYDIITVFGATGKVGREMLEFFSQGGTYCRAVTRDLKKVKAHSFVTWIEGNLADKNSLYNAIAGSKRLFLTTSFSEKMADLQSNAIDVAREAGVEHIVKLSTKGVSEKSDFLIPKLHYQIEQKLKSSGLNWTILQPSSFMQNWLGDFSDAIKKERKIYDAVGDIKMPFVDARDIAEVAVRILITPEKHVNKTYMLTGSEAVSYYEVAEAVSQAIHEPVTYISQTPEEARKRLEAKGLPEWAVKLFLVMAKNQQADGATVSTAVQEILGKPSRNVYYFAKDYASWFK
ncbi:MAG TPA: SDR family oxidoreductase [Cyclobacteriaceae bacterium]|nr:SDR family oxidoreductase [Cyclobacteriaceae bacterium]